jgi:RNA polymerase sigma factor (sigma-70 family)
MKGRRDAQKRLYDRFARRMLALCFRYCNSLEEAEDVLQEGFIKVFTCIGEYRRLGSLEGWIRKIMVNTALNHLRATEEYRFTEDLDGMPDGLQPAVMPGNTMETKHLISLVKSLPTGYRTVFNLFEVEGYSHKEIAKMLGVSTNTTKSQLRKAKQQLQLMLEREQNERDNN